MSKNVWGEAKVKLLDTTFWESLSKIPSKYVEKQCKKLGLLECDYAHVRKVTNFLFIKKIMIDHRLSYSASIGGWELWRIPTSSWREKCMFLSQMNSLLEY